MWEEEKEKEKEEAKIPEPKPSSVENERKRKRIPENLDEVPIEDDLSNSSSGSDMNTLMVYLKKLDSKLDLFQTTMKTEIQNVAANVESIAARQLTLETKFKCVMEKKSQSPQQDPHTSSDSFTERESKDFMNNNNSPNDIKDCSRVVDFAQHFDDSESKDLTNKDVISPHAKIHVSKLGFAHHFKDSESKYHFDKDAIDLTLSDNIQQDFEEDRNQTKAVRRSSRRISRLKKSSVAKKSPYTDLNYNGRKGKHKVKLSVRNFPNTIIHLRYNPFDTVDSEKCNNFMSWYEKNRNSFVHHRINMELVDYVSPKWFGDILNTRGLLNDEHIDVLMHLVLVKRKQSRDDFLKDWTCVDLQFSEKLKILEELMFGNLDSDSNLVLMMKYVNGLLPKDSPSLCWENVKNVYGVAYVNSYHWVLYEIIPEHHHITVYDSLSTSVKSWSKDQTNLFQKFASLMPTLLPDKKYGKKMTWAFDCFSHSPKQQNLVDCGILCVKYFECLVTGRSLSEIDVTKTKDYRKSFCYDIWKLS